MGNTNLHKILLGFVTAVLKRMSPSTESNLFGQALRILWHQPSINDCAQY